MNLRTNISWFLPLLALVGAAACSASSESPPTATVSGELGGELNAEPAVATCDVSPFKELEIVDPSVVSDPVLTSNAGTAPGHFSFRFLAEQMTPPGQNAAVFVESWINLYASVTSVNGDPVTTRSTASFLPDWKRDAQGRLDLAKNPMRLLAIVYRPDLANDAKPAGEGRFVFGVQNSFGGMESMTVILEFALPTTTRLTPQRWAKRFHSLGALAFGAAFNQQLVALTDRFAGANAVPPTAGNPAGSALAQLRSNEILMSSPWQLREFNIVSGALAQVTVKETPDHSNTSQMKALGAFASDPANFADLRSPTFSFENTPALQAMLGGNSDEDGVRLATAIKPPKGAVVPADILTKLAQNTCDGCHNSEAANMGGNLDGFYHVSPFQPPTGDNTNRLSGFIKADIAAGRVPAMQAFLGCPGVFAARAVRVH